LKQVHEDDLELYLLSRLSEREAAELEAHVRDCGQCEARLNDAVQFVRQLAEVRRVGDSSELRGTRKENRIPTNDPANARLYDPLLSEPVEVQVLNASKGGLLLRTSRSFHMRALIQLRLRSTIVVGEVRHCSAAGDSFHVGIQIQSAHALSEGAEEA
jgi:anti-sigma factor RsiW